MPSIAFRNILGKKPKKRGKRQLTQAQLVAIARKRREIKIIQGLKAPKTKKTKIISKISI